MKIIEIPAEVTLLVPVRDSRTMSISEVEQKSSFGHFLKQVVDNYQGFAKGPKMARKYNKFLDIVEHIKPEDTVVRFEDEDFEILRAAVDSASWLTGKINAAYEPYYNAIEKAQTVNK